MIGDTKNSDPSYSYGYRADRKFDSPNVSDLKFNRTDGTASWTANGQHVTGTYEGSYYDNQADEDNRGIVHGFVYTNPDGKQKVTSFKNYPNLDSQVEQFHRNNNTYNNYYHPRVYGGKGAFSATGYSAYKNASDVKQSTGSTENQSQDASSVLAGFSQEDLQSVRDNIAKLAAAREKGKEDQYNLPDEFKERREQLDSATKQFAENVGERPWTNESVRRFVNMSQADFDQEYSKYAYPDVSQMQSAAVNQYMPGASWYTKMMGKLQEKTIGLAAPYISANFTTWNGPGKNPDPSKYTVSFDGDKYRYVDKKTGEVYENDGMEGFKKLLIL